MVRRVLPKDLPKQVGFNEALGSAIHTHPKIPERIEDAASGTSTAEESPFDASVTEELEGVDETSTALPSDALFAHALGMADDLAARASEKEEVENENEVKHAGSRSSLKAAQSPDKPGSEFTKKKVTIEEPKKSEFAAPSDLDLRKAQADYEQKAKRQWTAELPDSASTVELERELEARQEKFRSVEAAARDKQAREAALAIAKFDEEQAQRRKQYEEEDRALLLKLEKELEERRKQRDDAERQRRLEIQNIEKELVKSGIVDSASLKEKQSTSPLKDGQASLAMNSSITSMPGDGDLEAGGSVGTLGTLPEEVPDRDPIDELPPMRYDEPADLPSTITDNMNTDVNFQIERMKKDEEEARKKGHMNMEEYERVKQQMASRQLERDQKLRALGSEEQRGAFRS